MSKIHAAMEVQLQEFNVKRQAYHSKAALLEIMSLSA